MVDIYFEKLIDNISNKKLIQLSEQRRAALDNGTVDQYVTYLNSLQRLCRKMKYNNIVLNEHPNFLWHGVQTTNWNYELLNITNIISEKYIQKAEAEHNNKLTGEYLASAIEYAVHSLDVLQYYTWCLPQFKTLPIMNERYHIHNIFTTMASKYFNMYDFKENLTAVTRAYQYSEIAGMMWKKNTITTEKYKALALRQVAIKMEDEQCGERVALLKPYANDTQLPPCIKEDYDKYKKQNDAVYFKPETTAFKLDSITLVEAFRNVEDTLKK
jgi:hypothetical protein